MDFVNPFKHKKPGDVITKQELISALRLSLCAEQEAIHIYDTIAEYVDDENVKKIMKDVANEEQVHVGEFQKLLRMYEDDETELLAKGEKEAEEKMGTEAEETEETEETDETGMREIEKNEEGKRDRDKTDIDKIADEI
jgi:rubrerythrin